MSITIPRGKTDEVLERIKNVLAVYENDHPRSRIDLYRQSPASIRVRIIDPDFEGMGRSVRNDLVWDILDRLPEDDQSDVSMLVLLTPEETSRSLANFEFEDPVPMEIFNSL